MKNILAVVVVLALCLFLAPVIPSQSVFADDGNITISSTYQTDSDGHNYGIRYYVSSSVSGDSCVFPYVVQEQNVNGSVGSPFQLQPNEQNVFIGEFDQADSGQAWSVNVSAKWRAGECADQ
jgi:hypothetical protein